MGVAERGVGDRQRVLGAKRRGEPGRPEAPRRRSRDPGGGGVLRSMSGSLSLGYTAEGRGPFGSWSSPYVREIGQDFGAGDPRRYARSVVAGVPR